MAAAASGGVPPLNVQIRITTTGAKAAANAMTAVTKSSQNMTRGFGAGVISARTLGDAMRMSASLLKYTVAGGFMAVGKAATQAYRNFELSFSRIQGLVGISSDAIREMKSEVLGMATETTRGPEELAEALYFITSAGLRDASTAMSVLKASAKAAASGLGDTKTVADAVTSSMNAYGAANLSASHATDVITAAVREGKAEADTMAPAFSKVLPVAAAFGASFEDVAAAMAALSRTGMTAGTAGIYVRQVLSQLLKPSKQASDALKAVGTSAEQIRTQVQEQGLFAALQNLSARLGGIENAEAFAKVFGNVRALTAVLQLVGPAAEENAVIFERLQNSTGDSADAFDAYSDTIDAKFNRAFAASRVALIEFGDALKPIVTVVLNFTTAAATIAKTLLSIPGAKVILPLLGVLPLLVVAISTVMKTTSALIRLFANLNITFRGTQLMYDATTKSIYKMTAAQVQQAQATRAATLGFQGWTKSTARSAKALQMFAAVGGKITALLMVVGFAATAFQMLRNRGKDTGEETDSLAESIGAVNELLDETVKYGKSALLFNVGINVEDTKLQKDMDRLKDQLEEQSPDFLDNIAKTLAAAGEESKAAYLNALLTGTFGGMTRESQNVIANLFAAQFGLDVEDIKNAVVPEATGDAVADALIFAAISGARGASEAAAKAIGGNTFADLNKAMAEAMALAAAQREKGLFAPDMIGLGVIEGLQEFGKSFTDLIQETEGNIAPLLVSLQEMEKAGTLTGDALEYVLGGSLKGLTGTLNLQSESAGNLAEVFKKTGNEAGLVAMIMKTANIGNSEATAIYGQLKEQMEDLPKGTNQSVEAFKLLSTALNSARVEAEDLDESQAELISQYEIMQQGIKDVISQYDEQTSMMKELEKAQRGLLGLALDQEEANNNLTESYNSFGNAVQKSKGSLDSGTQAGIAARQELVANAEAVLDLANVYAAAGDAKGAGEVFSAGIAELVNVASKAGGELAGIEAANLLETLGFTAQNFKDSLLATETAIDSSSVSTGKAVVDGIAKGIQANQSNMSQALINALNGVMVIAKETIDSKSPSRRTAKEIGLPMAQGVEVGFTKYASSGKFKNSITKTLDKSIEAAYKAGGRKGASKFFEDFLDRKKNVETPAQDFVKATIGRMKDIIGSLGDYIKSQLNFRRAQADLAKLINMQRGLDDRRRKAAREQQYSETRFGMGGGAEVTGYEQAQIDELQLAFERVSRDYAMGRASYVELVDAEIALYEARAAASEVNDDVINAQNDFIDATVDVENAELEVAEATVNVLEAYQDVQEAAAELYMNHKELASVYNSLADATGIASGKLKVGNRELTDLGREVSTLGGFASTVGGYMSTLGNNVSITGQQFTRQFDGPGGIFAKIVATGGNITNLTNSIGARFTDLSKGLLDPEGQFSKDLKSLGPSMWRAIQIGAQESLDKSPLQLRISVNAVVDKSGSGSLTWSTGLDVPSLTPTNYRPPGQGATGVTQNIGVRAVGGPVAAGKPYIVGERGPEMFLPKVSGTIITNNALDRYTRVRQTGPSATTQSQNNISVTVNNPVPETATDSITRRMKVLSNSGLFG